MKLGMRPWQQGKRWPLLVGLVALWLWLWLGVSSEGLTLAKPARAESTDSEIEVIVLPVPTPTPTPVLVPTPVPSLTFPETEKKPPVSEPGCGQPSPGEQAAYLIRATRIDATAIELEFEPAQKPWTHYLLRYGHAGQPWSFGATIDSPQEGRFIVQGLVVGVSYDFQILAANGCAVGPESNTLRVSLRGDGGFWEDLFNPDALAVGESVTAPDLVLPLEPEASSTTGITAGDNLETITLPTELSWGEVLGRLFIAGQCRFTGFWWWLCWPWWFLILMAIILYLSYRYQQRLKKRSQKNRRRFYLRRR